MGKLSLLEAQMNLLEYPRLSKSSSDMCQSVAIAEEVHHYVYLAKEILEGQMNWKLTSSLSLDSEFPGISSVGVPHRDFLCEFCDFKS